MSERYSVSPQSGEGPRQWKAGRVCSYPGCSSILSRYNGTSRCVDHSTVREVRFPCSPGQSRSRRSGGAPASS